MTRMDFWDRANAVYPSTESTSGYLKPLARLFSPGRRVADLGCGRGEMLALLRDAGHTAIGVDLSRRSQDWAAESGFDFHRVDVLDFLAKPPVAFNALFSYGLLEHLDVEDFRRLFRLAGENSPSGTEVVFATHDPSSLQSHLSPLYRDVTHSRLYALESVASELEANGFHVKKSGSIEQTESLVPAGVLGTRAERGRSDRSDQKTEAGSGVGLAGTREAPVVGNPRCERIRLMAFCTTGLPFLLGARRRSPLRNVR